MKNIFVTIGILLLLPPALCGQEKEVRKALQGYPIDYCLYEVKYTDKNCILEKRFNKWYEKNQDKYFLLGKNVENSFFRGTTRSCVKGFLFLKNEDLPKYRALLDERKKEKERIAASKISWRNFWNGFVAGAAIYAVYKIGEWAYDRVFPEDPDKQSFISCSNPTRNSIDLYILAIGTDVKEESIAMDNDANSLTDRLRKGCGDKDLFGNIYSKILTGTDATKANILEALSDIKECTNEDDIFLLFFSGHGGFNSDRKFIFGSRNGDITVDEIVVGMDADNCKTILWFDACHAGQVGNDFRNGVDDYIRNKRMPNVSILMSSSDNESSWTDANYNLGFFAKAIIDGLDGAADAGDMNHIISLRELVNYVIRVVPQRTKKSNCSYCVIQTPQILNEGKSFGTRLSKY
ncbi:MAG: caspase family protein [Bacteroidales bacterium]|jgi:hypothetical protein|nr:caspase family protein [Bacteroidales bacterium]